MQQNLIDLYKKTRELHLSIVQQMETINLHTASCGDMKATADTAFALREIAEFAEQVKKQADKMAWLAQKTTCFIYVSTQVSGTDPIRTDYCTATPDIKPIVSLPDKRKQPVEYAAVMDHYNIPVELYGGENPIIEARWPGVIERIGEDMKKGLPLPPGIDPTKLTHDYRLRILKRKGVAE